MLFVYKTRNTIRFLICLLLTGCNLFGDDSEILLEECVTRPAQVFTIAPPAASCGPPGPKTIAIMSDINNMWESQMVACVCGSDFPGLPFCANNAAVLSPSIYGAGALGYIFYDPNFLQILETRGQGSLLGPAWFLAHEAGHNIQNNSGVSYSATKLQELSADCFSGYFIGKLVCDGRINQNDIDGLLASICSVGDPIALPWFAPGVHGTCAERIDATLRGINAYLNGKLSSLECF